MEITTETQEKIISKIQKLLALSESPNEHESQSALAKAQKLMAEYNVSVTTPEEDPILVIEMDEDTVGISVLRKTLATSLAKHFGCKVMYSKSYKDVGVTKVEFKLHTRIQFVGTPIMVKTLKMSFDYAWEVFLKLSQKFISSEYYYATRSQKLQLKQDYLVGFCKGMTNELIRSANQYALVVSVPHQVNDYVSKVCRGSAHYKHLDGNVKNSHAVRTGYADGAFSIRNQNKAIGE